MLSYILLVFLIISVIISGAFVAYNVLFFLGHFFLKCKNGQGNTEEDKKLNSFAVIIPAHNEELLIGRLIESASNIDYPAEYTELIIVADNCIDQTADIAIERGIKCLIRKDESNRGKPYALDWALRQIAKDEYDAYVIIDADTTIDSAFLKAMNAKLNKGAEAIQGYFDIMNPRDSWLTRLAVLPGILKFKMRYAVKEKLKLSCPLMGNGMCFSRNIIEKYGWNAYSITENWEYFVKLLLNGHRVNYEHNAIIYSHAVTALSHGETQRKRWLKGQLGVLFDYYKDIIKRVVMNKSIVALDALIELLLPSYSMLLIWTIGTFFILVFLSWIDVRYIWLRNTSAVLVLAQVIYCLYAFALSKPSVKTWISLAYIPLFLFWKLVVTIKGVFELKDKTWVKTDRRL